MTLSLTTITFAHVLMGLLGIVSGLGVLFGLLFEKRMEGWTHVFLLATTATTLTGFLFPIHGFTPALAVGIVLTIVLAVAIAARYVFRLAGRWRTVFVVGAVAAFCFSVFMLALQAYLDVPDLHALAPHGLGPSFAAA